LAELTVNPCWAISVARDGGMVETLVVGMRRVRD